MALQFKIREYDGTETIYNLDELRIRTVNLAILSEPQDEDDYKTVLRHIDLVINELEPLKYYFEYYSGGAVILATRKEQGQWVSE